MITSSIIDTKPSSEPFAKRSMTPEREQRKSQIIHRLKMLRQSVAELERELSRVELGLPEPYRYDHEWVPPFIRRDYEVYDKDRRNGERGDDRRACGDGA